MDELLPTARAAEELGVAPERVRQLVKDGRMTPAMRVRGAYLFSRAEVERVKATPRQRTGRPPSKEPAPKRPRGRPRRQLPANPFVAMFAYHQADGSIAMANVPPGAVPLEVEDGPGYPVSVRVRLADGAIVDVPIRHGGEHEAQDASR